MNTAAQRLAALLEINEALVSACGAREVLQKIADDVSRLSGLRRACIFAYDSAMGVLNGITSQTQDATGTQNVWAALAEVPLAEQAMRTGAPVLCKDVRAVGAVPAWYIERLGLKHVCCIPLIAKDHPLGVIFLDDHGRTFRWSRQRQQLVTAFGNLAAIALENARLDAALQESAVLRERARLVQELHDSVAQSFFSIGLVTGSLLEEAPAGAARQRLEQVQHLAARGETDIRKAIVALSPAAASQDLLPALTRLTGEYHVSGSCEVEMIAAGRLPPLPAAAAEILYAAAREALENARRHARATAIKLHLHMEDDWVGLTVSDNGRGHAAHVVAASFSGPRFGLRSLHGRVTARGGEFTISDNEGGGIAVTVRFPCDARQSAADRGLS